MKTMQKMKTKRITTHVQKACCALLTPCILLSACQKSAENSPQDAMPESQKLTATPQTTQTPVPTLTAAPKPTLTNTPIPSPTNVPPATPTPTPEPTLTPTPMPDFTFIPQPDEPDKTSLLDYMSQEQIDAALSLSYDPDSPMQLYARYQGQLQYGPDCYYCIDLICVNGSTEPMLINIKILSGWYRFLKDGDSTLLQNLYYYIDPSIEPDTAEIPFQIVDLNGDGYKDFIFDLGIVGVGRNSFSVAFVYDTENKIYTLLDDFYTATYIPEKQTIIEESYSPMNSPAQKYKYLVVGTEAILTEFINYIDDSYTDSYTYQKLIDGEMVTILEDATYKEMSEIIVDFETWRATPASLE